MKHVIRRSAARVSDLVRPGHGKHRAGRPARTATTWPAAPATAPMSACRTVLVLDAEDHALVRPYVRAALGGVMS